ncbi:MAG: DUF4124 domain-containing protein [Gammaproteobacteria bacterium]|nr:DUF4124 domain-containing protein [Gammaproteobacteria bacterium]
MTRSLLLLLFAFVLTPAYGASFYKWTDNEGQTHYTRKPPPKEHLKSKTTDKVPTEKVKEAPVVQEPTKLPAASAALSAKTKQQQELCQSTQYSLKAMRQSGKILEYGHEIEITPEERNRRIAELEEAVKNYCQNLN